MKHLVIAIVSLVAATNPLSWADEIQKSDAKLLKFFSLDSHPIPQAALLPQGSRGTVLGGGCVLGSNVQMDGWWKSGGKETGFQTGADSMRMRPSRDAEITHFMIEIAPTAASEASPHLAEFEVSAGVERLEFVPKPVWSTNESAAFPAANAVDYQPGTGWRPNDPSKNAIAIFALTRPLQHTYFAFKTAANQNYVLQVNFRGADAQPIQGNFRATAIYSKKARPDEDLPHYDDYCPPPVVKISDATEPYFQQTKTTHIHRFVEIKPDESGRFLKVEQALAAATQAGITSLHFIPRPLQTGNVEQAKLPYPPAVELIAEIERLQGIGQTTLEENFRRMLQIAGLFERAGVVAAVNRDDMHLSLDRQSKAGNRSIALLHETLAELYHIHPAPLLWLELNEQLRLWDEQHFATGVEITPPELAKWSFGAASSNGLRVAMEISPAQPAYRNGETVERTFVFHNSGSATIQLRVPSVDKQFRGFLWNRLVHLTPGQICRLPTSPIVLSEEIHGPQLQQPTPPEALETSLLVTRPWPVTANGLWFENRVEQALKLTTGAIEFRVGFADPAKEPLSSANSPGVYHLAPGIILKTSRMATPEGEIANAGLIQWVAPDPESARKWIVLRSVKVALEAGLNCYNIVWAPGSGEFWISDQRGVRRLDFATSKLVERHWSWSEASLVKAPANVKAKLARPSETR